MSYHVEHLATFSTLMPTQQQITPKVALQRLFAMEKTSGIWTQKMTIQTEGSNMLIYDRESNDVVEDFPVANINQPIAFSHSNHIYDNILMFTVKHPKETEGELHIFQCTSDYAQKIAEDLNNWMSKHGNNNQILNNHNDSQKSAKFGKPPASQSVIKVKEAVSVFNRIAAERNNGERKSNNAHVSSRNEQSSPIQRDQDVRSITTNSSVESRDQLRANSGNESATSLNSNNTTSNQSLSNANNETNLIGTTQRNCEQPLSIEKYVTVLNHCFDEIERFSLRLQHAAAAYKELQMRNFRKKEKGGLNGGDGLMQLRARGPSEEDYFEILGKFKLSFNLLAKLKGFIHDPNSPELVHFLFTPLAIIIEAAKNNPNIPIDPTAVEMPFLHSEAIDLLSNCCTSKEFDLWQSLGPNWTQPRHVVNTPKFPMYRPVFSDGWAPQITEPELIGFQPTAEQLEQNHHHSDHYHHQQANFTQQQQHSNRNKKTGHNNCSDSDERDDQLEVSGSGGGGGGVGVGNNHFHYSRSSPVLRDGLQFESIKSEQKNYLVELQNRNARILRVLYPRSANNEKELTVFRDEILELLDSSRNWWRAMNSRKKVGFLPNTICQIVKDLNLDILNNEKQSNMMRTDRQVGKRGEFRYF